MSRRQLPKQFHGPELVPAAALRAVLVGNRPAQPSGPQPGAYWYYMVIEIYRPGKPTRHEAHEVAYRPGPISMAREIAGWAEGMADEIHRRDLVDDPQAPRPDVTVRNYKLLRFIPREIDEKLQELEKLDAMAQIAETLVEETRAHGDEPTAEDVEAAKDLRAKADALAAEFGLSRPGQETPAEEPASGLVIP